MVKDDKEGHKILEDGANVEKVLSVLNLVSFLLQMLDEPERQHILSTLVIKLGHLIPPCIEFLNEG